MLIRNYSLGNFPDNELLERLLPLFAVLIIRAIILIRAFDKKLNGT